MRGKGYILIRDTLSPELPRRIYFICFSEDIFDESQCTIDYYSRAMREDQGGGRFISRIQNFGSRRVSADPRDASLNSGGDYSTGGRIGNAPPQLFNGGCSDESLSLHSVVQ